MNIAKIVVLITMALVATTLATTFVSAQNLEILYVKINGEEFDPSVVGNHTNNLKVERGDELKIKVRVKALADVSNVQVEADIFGYRFSHRDEGKVSDTSKVFDMEVGDVDTIDLDLEIPIRMDKKFTLLRVRVADEDGLAFENNYQLHVFGIDDEHAVIIKDVEISPSSSINAGRAFTAMVRVENIGDDDLDDIKVTISVPELNIRDSEFLDELDADEKETLEEFLLRIPDCAAPGIYDVEIVVEFDEFETETARTQINVIPGDSCKATSDDDVGSIVITPSAVQEVSAGSETAFPIMIDNQASTSKTFVVAVSGVEGWGTSRVSPSSVVVVPAGEAKTVFVYVQANKDAVGEKVFLASVSGDGESESFPLTANVVEGSGSGDLNRGLGVALAVLVIILIIVGLIIGFNKLRGQEDSPQTYY